ncbi:MAG: type VI secretion system tip protein TssI/VgrG [Bryobacteraceae bacterium]
MPGDYTSVNRLLRLSTPLGADKLILTGFTGTEELSRLFRFQLDVVSLDRNIAFDSIVGKNLTFGLELHDGSVRHFNGFVSRFSQGNDLRRFSSYQLEVVPWFWFLTRMSDCRIFQDKTVLEIVKEVFNDAGFPDFEDKTQGSYKTRIYTTQYRETSFNFVSRLLEEEGIFYYFRHENGKHMMVLADNPAAHKECPGGSKFDFAPQGATETFQDGIRVWSFEHAFRTGAYELGDYNFEKPNLTLQSGTVGLVNEGGNQKFQIFDYPGGFQALADGEKIAKIRMDEEEAPHAVANGESDARTLCAGFTFDMKEHPRRSSNGSYILTAVRHYARQPGEWAPFEDQEAEYGNSFSCIPKAIRFRPPRLSPKPFVQGSQTAIVTGPSGEEIYVDKYGRVKVQFHWDRRGKYDEKSSCWIRAAQIWAGKGWGAVFHPRIGQEVIVDFLEGDPDQPIITGRVYNGGEMPPYSLPGEQTKTAIKSYSSKGGGGFNEFRFEDKKGSEQVFIHAEKDMHERVKEASFETIGKDRNLIVGGDQLEKVSGDKHLTVKGNQNEKVDGTVSLKAGMNLQQKVGMNWGVQAGTDIHLKSGVNMMIESGTMLTLKVGGSFIALTPAAIFIQGTMVMINSGGAAGSGAGCSPTAPKDPKEADKAEPGQAPEPPQPKRPPKPPAFGPQAQALADAAKAGAPFCAL